jgi:hypothetical protein
MNTAITPGTRFTRDGASFTVQREYLPGMWEARGPRGEIVIPAEEIRAYLDAERQQRAERIARDNLDAVLGNAPSPRLDALDADDYAQLLAAFTRAALAGMEAAR